MIEKMKLIERLVKDGSIDLAEAMMLLEKDTMLQPTTNPVNPLPLQPYNPVNPSPYRSTGNPLWWQYPVTCNGLTVGENVIPLTVGGSFNFDVNNLPNGTAINYTN